MLYWMCEKSNSPPTGPQLEHAIKRNFGGLDSLNTDEIFKKHLGNLGTPPDLSNATEEVSSMVLFMLRLCLCVTCYIFRKGKSYILTALLWDSLKPV